MWLRDAVKFDLLPKRASQAARTFSPYRYGSAMWAYLAGRFGDRVMAEILGAAGAGSFDRRIRQGDRRRARSSCLPTGAPPPTRPTVLDGCRGRRRRPATVASRREGRAGATRPVAQSGRARMPIFFSERDRLSLDLFLADTTTGTITRKLATTTATARIRKPAGDSIRRLVESERRSVRLCRCYARAACPRHPGCVRVRPRSADRASATGTGLDAGMVSRRPLDRAFRVEGRRHRLVPLRSRYGDAAAADERSLFGSAAGVVAGRARDRVRHGSLFNRSHLADLRPVVSLRCSIFRPAPSVRSPRLDAAKHVNPQWSGDGRSLFFISDPGGISNVYRLDLASGGIYQISHAPGGVAGLAPTSPALSVARDAPVMIFTAYRRGTYTLEIHRGRRPTLTGTGIDDRLGAELRRAAADGARRGRSDDRPRTTASGCRRRNARRHGRIPPNLSLEAIGQPYLSSGGGPFGTFVRGGGSLLFGDMLGERKLGMAVQFGNHLSDLGLGAAVPQ